MNTIRILISLGVNLNWNMHQYDIKNPFLHGNLVEEILSAQVYHMCIRIF